MKRKAFIVLAMPLLFTLSGFLVQPKKFNVWMMGDSTMSIKAKNKFPETGWGEPFSKLFQNHVSVHNLAKNGRSTKSFINEGLWNTVSEGLGEGDYVFIQFGHNDEKINKPSTGTSISEYKKNLAMFVEKTRAKNATPILLTPIARRAFENGQLRDTHGEYPQAVRKVADSLGVVLIDMTKETDKLLRKKGEKKSVAFFLHLPPGHENYPNGVTDNTHLNTHGAKVIADLVVKSLKKQKIPLVKDLK